MPPAPARPHVPGPVAAAPRVSSRRGRRLGWLDSARSVRRLVAGVCVAGLVAMHFMAARIETVSPYHFDSVAVEIQRAAGWRYGYVYQFGGPVLVRAVDDLEAPEFEAPIRPDAMSALMLRQVRGRGLKTWAELVFYGALGFYPVRAARLRRPWSFSASGRARSAAAAAAGFVALALAPYALTGYGEPLFQSLYRAAIATTTQQLVPITGPVEPTVSYTVLVQALTAVPLTALVATLGARASRPGMLWLVSAVTWAYFAWFASHTRSTVRRWWHTVCPPPSRRDG